MPERIPDRMSERMQKINVRDRMPDRMPERMSDKNVREDCQGMFEILISVYTLHICHGGGSLEEKYFLHLPNYHPPIN